MIKKFEIAKKKGKDHQTIVSANGVKIGGKSVVIIAGPCAVESREQLFSIAAIVKESGALILRGGAFKPRTSPYSFQGLGEEALEILMEAKEAFGLLIVTEVMDVRNIAMVSRYADIIQVGARNMQNYVLLQELGKIDKPILLKKGMMASVYDTLMAAEYILAGGNHDVIICERGIRTFETYTRNTFDISAVVALKTLTHLPVIFDPSHASGRSDLIPGLLRAGIAAGADGAIVEVHSEPENALCDGEQALLPKEFKKVMAELKGIAEAVGRTL